MLARLLEARGEDVRYIRRGDDFDVEGDFAWVTRKRLPILRKKKGGNES